MPVPERVRLVFEAVGIVAVIAAVVGLSLEVRARDEDRVNRAWMLVAQGVGLRQRP